MTGASAIAAWHESCACGWQAGGVSWLVVPTGKKGLGGLLSWTVQLYTVGMYTSTNADVMQLMRLPTDVLAGQP